MHNGVIARTVVLDRLTKAWLERNSGAAVVNIACGLDTRCYRMSGYSHWYNLDLPETIAVRQRLLPEDGVISQIAMSAMDDWGGRITELGQTGAGDYRGTDYVLIRSGGQTHICGDFRAV